MNALEFQHPRPIQILLVEDDEQDYKIISDLFSDIEGTTYTVDWVATYQEGTHRIHLHRYDLFLFDYRLGSATGLDLVKYARQIHASSPSILLTGQEDRHVDLLAGKTGVVDYLIKGELTASALERSIRYALERRKTEIERERLTEQLLETSRQLGMAEVATNVLHNVGNVLNSINVSATQLTTLLQESHTTDIGEISIMIQSHLHDLENFLTQDAKGKLIPSYLTELDKHVAGQHQAMVEEIQALTKNLEHIKHIVRAQQANTTSNTCREPTDIAELMEHALAINFNALSHHSVTIVRDYGDIPSILTDKHQILQILVNLIRNAKRAMSNHPADSHCLTLIITQAPDHSQIQLSVQDTGVGIHPTQLTKIFSQGFTTKPDGQGLGLHSSALAAQSLQGTLHGFSAGEGQGARFTLNLPFVPVEVFVT